MVLWLVGSFFLKIFRKKNYPFSIVKETNRVKEKYCFYFKITSTGTYRSVMPTLRYTEKRN